MLLVANMGFRRRSVEQPELTPMIDVVFLLLIFFMISTTFIERPGLEIDLPDSSVQQLQQVEKEVQVYLTASGELFFERQPIAMAELADKLARFGTAADRMTFLLMADKSARHGKVVQLMDLAKTSGFEKLAIATDKQQQSTD
jgi:biopolymer transport protein ExbD/biopolymer transport protein TolR